MVLSHRTGQSFKATGKILVPLNGLEEYASGLRQAGEGVPRSADETFGEVEDFAVNFGLGTRSADETFGEVEDFAENFETFGEVEDFAVNLVSALEVRRDVWRGRRLRSKLGLGTRSADETLVRENFAVNFESALV